MKGGAGLRRLSFVTVEATPDLQKRLEELGLGLLTAEGYVGTVGTQEKNILGV